MRAIRLRSASLAIPFRSAFAHASAKRAGAENILVEAEDAAGRRGYGEGCPRAYVTGETVETARAFLERQEAALLAVDDVAGLRRWLAEQAGHIDQNPSAACAAELALLDLFARQAGTGIETLLELPEPPPVTVTAVYGLGPAPVFRFQHIRFALNGMRDAKLKLSGRSSDRSRAARLARFGRLRLDANNLWPDAPSAVAGLRALAPLAWAVEEPVRARDWPAIQAVAAETGLQVILDESFTAQADLGVLGGDPRFVVNLRVSKLGGLLRTLDAAALARAAGHGVIVGAQVGETSLLARAGLIAAAAAGPALLGCEFGYGLHLLRHDLVTPSLTVGRGGRLAPPPGGDLQPSPELRAAFAGA